MLGRKDVPDFGTFLYNWQTLIAGVLAIAAAIVGGRMAYRAGKIQAQATKDAAQRQLIANSKPICVLMPFDGFDSRAERNRLLSIIDHPSSVRRLGIVELRCRLRNLGPGAALNLAIMFRFLDMQGHTTAPCELDPLYPGENRGGPDRPIVVPIQIDDGFNESDFLQIEGKLWEIILMYEDVFGNQFYSKHRKSPIQVDKYFSSTPAVVPQAWVVFGEGRIP